MGKIDLSFDHTLSDIEIKELSVVSYADSFFYGLWSTQGQLVKTGYHPYESLESILALCQFHYDITKVKLLSVIKPFVHIAAEEVEMPYFDIYFRGLYKIDPAADAMKQVDELVGSPVMTLHYTSQQVTAAIGAHPWTYKMAHISTAMANYCHLEQAELVCFIANNVLHITLLDEDGFKLYNQYACHYDIDFLYYLIMVMEVFELDPAVDRVNIGGDIALDSEIYLLLSSYVKHLCFVDEQLEYSTALDVPKSHYYDLYLCKTCV